MLINKILVIKTNIARMTDHATIFVICFFFLDTFCFCYSFKELWQCEILCQFPSQSLYLYDNLSHAYLIYKPHILIFQFKCGDPLYHSAVYIPCRLFLRRVSLIYSYVPRIFFVLVSSSFVLYLVLVSNSFIIDFTSFFSIISSVIKYLLYYIIHHTIYSFYSISSCIHSFLIFMFMSLLFIVFESFLYCSHLRVSVIISTEASLSDSLVILCWRSLYTELS